MPVFAKRSNRENVTIVLKWTTDIAGSFQKLSCKQQIINGRSTEPYHMKCIFNLRYHILDGNEN
jgi:hypothetical protein